MAWFESLARWSLRRIGVYNLLVLSLISSIMILAGYGFSEVVNGITFSYLAGTVMAGTLTGWYLAPRLKKPAHLVLALLFAGVLVLFLSLPGTLPVLSEIVISLSNRLHQGRPWRENWAPLLASLSGLGLLVANFVSRPLVWLTTGLRSGFDSDPLVVRIIWGSAAWGVSTWGSAYFRKTHRGLAAIAPVGALLAMTINYVRQETEVLILIAGGTLLLMAAGEARLLKAAWERDRKDYSDELPIDMGASAIFVSVVLALFAWITPSISVRQIARAAMNAIRPKAESAQPFAESIGLEPGASNISDPSSVRFGGLPRKHLIGSGPELDERIVLVITTGDLPPMTADQMPPGGAPRYYWKSINYSEYLGNGWQTGAIYENEYAPGEVFVPFEPANIRQISQHVTGLENLNQVLFAAGAPVSADARTSVFWRIASGEERLADLFTIRIEANDYRVTSSVPNVGTRLLENAPTRYPDWIRETYLQLPEDLPRRVHNLAIILTQDQDSVYAKAKAIEAYLRRFEYSLDLPQPPIDRDIVDYFLFTLRQGYCDYYASSMVVLARAAGIPARLAVGYASGTYDPNGARYVVTAADAHSWPEIYFPEYGWIEFEPTGGQAPLDRQTELPEYDLPAEFQADGTQPSGQASRFPRWSPQIAWIVALIATLILVPGLLIIVDRARLISAPGEKTIARLYQRAQKATIRLTGPAQASETPSEFAGRFARNLKVLKPPGAVEPLIKPVSKEITLLVNAYNRATYSAHTPRQTDKIRLIRVWYRMRIRLLLARMLRLLGGRKT